MKLCTMYASWIPLLAHLLTQPLTTVQGFAVAPSSESSTSQSHFGLHAIQLDEVTTRMDDVSSLVPSNNTQSVTAVDTPQFEKQPTVASSDPLELWKRRLITHEDPFSLHKLAALGYTASSAVLLGTAAVQALRGEFSTIPSAMEPVMHVFTLSNVIMCAASVKMAFQHRQGDLIARNAFLGTAVSSLFSGFFLVWISPFAMGNVFDNLWISRACFAVLVGLNAVFIADTVLNTQEIVEGQQDKKAEEYQGRVLLDTLGYVFPVAWGMPLIASTGLFASVLHDRAWFLDQVQFIDQVIKPMGTPGIQAHIFYQQLVTSLAASYASLFVTLRDKRLITKKQELGGITVFAVPALVWLVYTTVIFTSSLFA